LLSYDLDYEEFANVTVENITNTIKCDIMHIEGYFVVYEDDRHTEVFKPLQFHFHAPSEHTFDGKSYDLELHIYHISIDRAHKSVLAVYFDTKVGGT
jgi:carbonic anhydrase